MKIKIVYTIPKIEVTKTIEVGNVMNNHLNEKQSKLVNDQLPELSRQAVAKLQEMKPNITIKPVQEESK